MIEITKVDQTGAIIDEEWECMRKELLETREDLRVALQQLVNMRKEQVAYKIILGRELGHEVDPIKQAVPRTRKNDRSYEQSYLKTELVGLVDHLQELDSKFHFDADYLPSSLSTSRECLLTEEQMEVMLNLYVTYNVWRSEIERKTAAAVIAYLKMRKDYETTLIHNNAMIAEIKSIRQRIEKLKSQEKEDKCFMDFLVSFKLYEEKPESEEPEKLIYTPCTVTGENVKEVEKYKTLWENNLCEKGTFQLTLETLKKHTEELHWRIVVAEKMCLENTYQFQDLEQKVQDYALYADDYRIKTDQPVKSKNAFKCIFWDVSGQLFAALNENKYIKDFIQKKLLPKEKDFLKLRSSLQAIADEYRQTIENATPKPPEIPEPAPEEESKPKKKKKGKK